jgi:hypothetical protein
MFRPPENSSQIVAAMHRLAGELEFARSVPRAANPHHPDGLAYAHWHSGWDEATALALPNTTAVRFPRKRSKSG